MDSILGILFNLFEGLDLAIILESIEGSLVEYDVSSVVDTFSSFFGGLLGELFKKSYLSGRCGLRDFSFFFHLPR